MNFISREQVIMIIKEFGDRVPAELLHDIETLFSFPAPNPDQNDDRNVMGQTEDEFWAAVERQDK